MIETDLFKAVFVGALAQARILGGSIGLTIGTNILNENVTLGTTEFLSLQQLSDLLQSAQTIQTLPLELQIIVKQVFGKGYDEEMQVLAAFGGAALLATLMMWERKPRRMR